ncbi:hypothetical protein MKW98_003683 [Papaver atlanticum]|uniref:DC1 domain-containing protein n=1 Tax=Papaver atlanticum TaxID=357466 RepID=A0AAD4SJ51_9MAGN|nr:hypothetical protein MKW98_003683 [Papaver atlanticum]
MGAIFSKKSESPANKIHHFTHRHTLKLVSKSKGRFVCKACGLPGMGLRYRCNKFCDWDIHETCAAATEVLSTHIHREHQLNLIWTKGNPDEHEVKRGRCGVCDEYVSGRLFYSCPFCPRKVEGFFLHPTCSTYPSRVDHPIDKHHHLTWQSGPQTWCTICRKRCPIWHYRCEPCSVDVHFECASIENGSSVHGNSTGGKRQNISILATVGSFFVGILQLVSGS